MFFKFPFLDAASHLHKRVCPSVRPSVGRSVGRSRFRQKRENRWFWSQIIMSHVITSLYNHFILMRTHRWPYGPCFHLAVLKRLMNRFLRKKDNQHYRVESNLMWLMKRHLLFVLSFFHPLNYTRGSGRLSVRLSQLMMISLHKLKPQATV